MGRGELHLRHVLAQEFLHLRQIGNAGADIEGLSAPIKLAQQRFADHDRIEGRYEGAHRKPVDRRRRDKGQFPHARQSELKSARYRCRGQSKHMNIGTQFLELLLVRHPEMLLLVDDQEPKIPEPDRLSEQCVGADDDIHVAARQSRLGFVERRLADQARGLVDAHGQPGEAFPEGLVVLARQERRGHHQSHLLAGHDRHEGGPQGHFRLAESDIAADQAVHRPPGGKILQHRADRGGLVFCLVEGKAGAELVVEAVGRRQHLAGLERACRRRLYELVGDIPDALLEAGLAGLPAGAAELVELDPASSEP